MRTRLIFQVSTITLFLCAFLSPSHARAAAARIEGLQLPAWVQRDHNRFALRPGFELQQGDRVETGPVGRVVMRGGDGSLIKLGVDARFSFDQLSAPAAADAVFTGVWQVLKGAFRFTTTALGADRKRDIRISVGVATVGIRGTDIWGRSNDEQDLVCLIEGQIEITRADDVPVKMTEPFSVYTALRSGPANPLSSVELPQLQQWGAETELVEGQGVLREDGAYAVYLLSIQAKSYAETMSERYYGLGYPAEVTSHTIDGTEWYRVGVAGFISARDAKAFADQIEGVLGTRGAWISRVK